MKLPRPTFSGMVATLALCVATSGTAYAAAALPRNSVGSPQIKTDAVRSPDIKNGGVGLRDLAPSVTSSLNAAGPPTAYVERRSTIQQVGATQQSFATMRIDEAGDYLDTVSLRVFPRPGNAGDGLFCYVDGGGRGNVSIVNNGVDMPQGVAEVTMHGILTTYSADTDLDLMCRAGANEVTLTYDWTAVQVDLD